jgi:ADP-ribosyl-[dinitrogen reductase] hydrolase
MAGALLGIDDGPQGLPQDLIEHIIEWPLTTDRLREMGSRLASDDRRPVPWKWMFQPLRNVLFLTLVLAHGFRRLLF